MIFYFCLNSSVTSNGKHGKSATRAVLCSLFVCLLAIIALAVALAIVVTKKIDDVNEPSPTIATNSGTGSQTGGNGCQTSGGGSNTNGMLKSIISLNTKL